MPALYYPPANRTAQWFGDDYIGSLIDPDKIVWHTTETGGWPGYGGGASAPHLTYHAEIHEWRQHYACNRSSRALRNEAGGVQTNTEDALQVEVVAYSDERLAEQRGHLAVSDLDSQALDDLADFSEWANREWAVPLIRDRGWLFTDFDRPPMTFDEWRKFAGHVGHNRVPENTHWDPARLDIDEILRRAGTPAAPIPTRKVTEMVVTKFGRTRFRAICGDRLVAISEADYERCKAAGIPAPTFDNVTIEHFEKVLISESSK